MKHIGRKLKSLMGGKPDRRHRLQHTATVPGLNLVTLGSDYGAWTFHDDGALNGCAILSAGLGEDASFDVEFAARYGARVVIIDPTPRATAHFETLSRRMGQARQSGYVPGGQQPAEAYDLAGVSSEQLILEPFALWTEETTLRFFTPENPDHVSHSLVNFQNDYRTDTAFIEVESHRIETVLDRHQIAGDDLALLKLDIEGAEVEVLQDLMETSVRPRQICVEFDELNKPGEIAFERVDRADAALSAAGYRCVYGNGTTDYLYLYQPERDD